MIYEDIEKQEQEFNDKLVKGIEIARENGVNLTKFKKHISEGLKTTNDEDQWTWDYECYLCSISRGRFESPKKWAVDFYQERWSL